MDEDLEAYTTEPEASRTLQDEEWETYIIIKLLIFVETFFKNKRKKPQLYPVYMETFEDFKLAAPFLHKHLNPKDGTVCLSDFVPTGWTIKRTHAFISLISFVCNFDIELNFSWWIANSGVVSFEKEKYLDLDEIIEDFINDNSIFFSLYINNTKYYSMERFSSISPCALDLPDSILRLSWIRKISCSEESRDLLKTMLNTRINDFTTGEISDKYGLLPFSEQRKIIINKLLAVYIDNNENRLWLNIDYKDFQKHSWISSIHMLVLLWQLEYITFHHLHKKYEYNSIDIVDYLLNGESEGKEIMFYLNITSKAEELFKQLIGIRDDVVDKIISNEHKHLRIDRKNSGIHIIEREIEITDCSEKIVDILRKYPDGDIIIKNYEGKISKIIVKARTKIDFKKRVEK